MKRSPARHVARPIKVAHLGEVKRILAHGGSVRFTYKTSLAILIAADGHLCAQLDKRTYDAFLRSFSHQLSRTESGSTENHDLVVEWREATASSPNP
jgi:hypothetical protein